MQADACSEDNPAPRPPVAPRRPRVREMHGESFVDDYAWLAQRDDPEVRAYLEAENAYTEAVMAPHARLAERVFAEIRSRVQESDESAPVRRGSWWWATRTVEGCQYPCHIRRRGGPDGAAEVVLDLNVLAAATSYLALGVFQPNPDQSLLAYSYDTEGGERYLMRFRDLGTGEDLADQIPDTYYGAAWGDSRTLHYVTCDAAMRPYRVWRHVVGTPATDDALVYEEADDRFFVSVSRARSGRYVFVEADSKVTSEVRVVDTKDLTAAPRLLWPRREGVEYAVDHRGDRFWFVTNDAAEDFRLVSAPVDSPADAAAMVEHIPGEIGRRLDAIDAFADHLILWGRTAGMSAAWVLDADGTMRRRIDGPEEVHTIVQGPNPEFDSNCARFSYTSLVTPLTAYDHDVATGKLTVVKREPVLGGYDPDDYETLRQYATAPDGTTVPVSVVRRSGTQAPAPLLLCGYGAYEIPSDPHFSSLYLSLLDRGVTLAIAHVRGGGELGRHWYDEGRMAHKPNTFSDFVAAAEHLVDAGYTTPDLLAARGASAGGLLMGAVANLRPDLWRAIVAEVPFVDVLNTMADTSLPLTVTEWQEWGDPRDPAVYEVMRAYSPYENVHEADYPVVFATAGLHDPRVQYWEPAKWVARLRAVTESRGPILLRTDMEAGHSGPSGRYDQWREEALVQVFLLTEFGLA